MVRIKSIFLVSVIWVLACAYQSPLIEWEDGIIPYYYSGNFSEDEILLIEEGMGRWEAVCGVTFIEVTPRAYAYEIRKIIGSYSWISTIGENNVSCFFNYGYSANPLKHIIHELGHCLGLIHEHQRPDRDTYVTILWGNIYPEYEHDFELKDNPLITEENYEYDYDSIMHYPRYAFSINGSETIIPADPNTNIGFADDISSLDAEKAREIYGPPVEDKDF
jgi:hypothetical protein